MEKSFLIIGNGELGMAVLNSLLDYQDEFSQKFEIAVLVQPLSATSQEILENSRCENVKLELIDLVKQNTMELAQVFRKYETVICCSGFSIGAGMQIKITQAVLEAGVKRYVPWQFGVDYDKIGRGSAQPVFDEQLDVRDLLRSQNNTHWIIVSTGMITSFLFREDFGVVNLSDKVIHALGDWEHSLTLTSCEDIGALTVKILFHQPEIIDQVVFVAGDTISFKEIADKMEKLFKAKFERILWSKAYLETELLENPENVFNRYRMVFTQPGVTWPLKETFNDQNNIAVVNIVQWASKNILKN